jgi:branched-chain amino acid transport system substrate-binding protein
MSTALTGPAQALGTGMRLGVEAYFQQVNDDGGVFGRPLRLIALDDQYEPLQTGPNMRALIDEHAVFAVLGNVGTPTGAVSVAIANEKKVPFFGAFTGAGILRKRLPKWCAASCGR